MTPWWTRGLCLATQLLEQETSHLRWMWEYPLWASVVCTGLLVLWVLLVYRWENATASWRWRGLLAALRIMACGLVLVMLAQPLRQWYCTEKPPLVILVDRSASMGTRDVAGEQPDVSRWQACQAALGAPPLLEELQQEYELHIVCCAAQCHVLGDSPRTELRATPVEDDPQKGTHLGEAVQFALRDLPGPLPAAVVLLTDGNSTGGISLLTAAEQARNLRVPLLAVPVGSDRPRPDVAVDNLIVEPIVFPGDRVQVEATLRATGVAGKKAQVSLQHARQAEILARTTVVLPRDGESQAVRLTWQPEQLGSQRLQLTVEPVPGEVDVENNRAGGTCEVRDEQVRVLLVDSSPSYEFRALRAMLQRDPVVDLRVVLQEADPDFAAIDVAAIRDVPAGEAELLEYDVIILGDVHPGLMPSSFWPHLETFVTVEGGGLVCVAGPRYMPRSLAGNPTAELLWPVELTGSQAASSEDRFALIPTTSGWLTPSLQLGTTRAETEKIWQGLPPLTWLWRSASLKPGAEVLARTAGGGWPVIIRHFVGAGEVWLQTTDETWRWRWRGQDSLFARYWGQVIRRLGRGRLTSGRQGVVLTTNREHYQPGESIRLQARFQDVQQAPTDSAGVVVQVQAEQGLAEEVALQRRGGQRSVFETSLQNLEPGNYEVVLLYPQLADRSARARFSVRRPPSELAPVAVDSAALRTAAALTGGTVLNLTRLPQLRKNLPAPQRVGDRERPPQKLWNTPLLLATLVAVLTTEWILRRKHGML